MTSPVPVAHSILDPDALAAEIAGAYRLPAPVRCALISPGVLFSRAPGRVLQYEEEDAFAYGQAAARLHSAMDSFQSSFTRFPMDLDHLLLHPLRLIEPFAQELGSWTFYQELAERLRQKVEAASPHLERGLCHGDLHGHNVHRAEDGTLTLFDFDCGGPGFRAYDLAVYRWAVGRHARDMQPWEAFVRGYRSLRRLHEADLEMTRTFVAIRIYWLLGLQVQQVRQRGTAWVRMWLEGAAPFLKRYDEEELHA